VPDRPDDDPMIEKDLAADAEVDPDEVLPDPPPAPRPLREHKNVNRAPRTPLNPATILLTSFGLGFMRPMPGTWGSLPPVILAVPLIMIGASTGVLLAAVISIVFGSWVCLAFGRYAETRFALPDGTPQKDAPEVVCDETAGCGVVLLAIPFEAVFLTRADLSPMKEASAVPSWLLAIVSLGMVFVLFRVFDIIKPWPVRWLEQQPHGVGVLIDDLAAGVYGFLAHVALYITYISLF
jgi:phosphatidylglycerophosphatase A